MMKRARLAGIGLALAMPMFGWAQGGTETPFQAETRVVTQALPCKWVAMGGRTGPSHGSGRFDFSCKGGTWGTVTLLLDAQGLSQTNLGEVRLGYRDWDPAVNPTAGEAAVAEQFLQFVLGRYVPASQVAEIRKDFWAAKADRWNLNGTKVTLTTEEAEGYTQRWLKVERPIVSAAASLNFTTMPPVAAPWRQGAAAQQETGLIKPTDAATAAPTYTPATPQSAIQLPNPALLPVEGVRREAPLQVPADAPAGAPRPRGEAPKSFMESAVSTLRGLAGLPEEPSPTAALPVPADLNRLQTAPALESKYRPTPPPPVSSSLIPPTGVANRPLAPTNFEAYNEAERLTQEFEAKARAARAALVQGISTTQPTPSMPSAPQAETIASPTLQVAPLQSPVQTPVPTQPAPVPPAATQPTAAPAMPTAPNDPRFAPSRELPQLKFIPKAEPIDTRNEVIRFEDEQQKL